MIGPRWLILPVVFIGSLFSSSAILWLNSDESFDLFIDQLIIDRNFADLKNALANNPAVDWWFMGQGVLVIFILSLLVGVTCSMSFTGDREKHLKALFQTPTKIRAVIRGKLKRRVRANLGIMLAYALPALALAWLAGAVSFAGTLLWGIAAWPILMFVGAVGIWSSIRMRYTVPSLFATFSFGLVGALVVFLLIVPVIMVVAIVIFMLLQIAGPQAGSAPTVFISRDPLFYTAFFLASAVVSAFVYFGLSRYVLKSAERRILSSIQGRR